MSNLHLHKVSKYHFVNDMMAYIKILNKIIELKTIYILLFINNYY